MNKILISALLCTLFTSGHAQGPSGAGLPSTEAIDAKRKEAADALSRLPQAGSATRDQLKGNRTSMNAVGSLPGAGQTPAQATKADFLAMVRPGQQQEAPAANPSPNGDLMIFVSLTMPDGMLEQYAAQAKRFNATLVLRGFVDDKLSSTRETLARLNRSGAQWDISPEPFKTFKIDKVPAIVLSTATDSSIMEDGCAHPEAYTAIFGDLPVIDALDKMSLRGQKNIAVLAKRRLQADRRPVPGN